MCTAVLISLAETPQPPSHAFGRIYEGAIGQPNAGGGAGVVSANEYSWAQILERASIRPWNVFT